jgi:hypothetical protein
MGRSIIKSRPRKYPKYLYVHLYGAYDLAPQMDEKDITAHVEITFANTSFSLPEDKIRE